MNRNKIFSLAMMLALWGPIDVFAGQESHGGDLVICANKPVVTLDYYHASLPTFSNPKPNTVDISNMTAKQVVEFFSSRLQGTVLQKKFNDAIEFLGPVDRWILKSLEDIDDSNEPYQLPASCQRVQGAMRSDDTMYIDPKYGPVLSASQRGMLQVHEALYYISKLDSSEKVRNLIRTLMLLNSTDKEVSDSLHQLNRIVYPFEETLVRLSGHYVPEKKPNGLKGETLIINTYSLWADKWDEKPPVYGCYNENEQQNGMGCQSWTPRIDFICNKEGTSCEVQSTSAKDGWAAGCKITFGKRAVKLDLICPNGETQTYFQKIR